MITVTTVRLLVLLKGYKMLHWIVHQVVLHVWGVAAISGVAFSLHLFQRIHLYTDIFKDPNEVFHCMSEL